MTDIPTVPPADPLADVRHGDPAGGCITEGIAAGLAAGRALPVCVDRDPLGLGLLCTRHAGHPGQHIAEGELAVAATWPAAAAA